MDLNKKLDEMPLGEQKLKIIYAEEKESRNGKPMFSIILESSERQTMWHSFANSKGGLHYLRSFSAACGLKQTELENFEIEVLKDRYVLATVIRNDDGFLVLQSNSWRKIDEGKAEDLF